MPKEKTAIVSATGEKIKVYRHALSDNWISSKDCETTYKPTELRINTI